MTTNSWRALADSGQRAFAAGETAIGRAVSERLLARDDVPDADRWQIRRDQIHFAPPLAAIAPGATILPVSLAAADGWSRFNPSIAATADGFRMIVRSANYTVERMRYTVHDDNRIARTENHLVTLDPDLAVRDAHPIADRTDRARVYPSSVLGYEDCRLFAHRGEWFATASTRQHNRANTCQTALLGLDEAGDGPVFRGPRLLSDGRTGRHEKNWMPFAVGDDLYFLYGCHPTVVLRYDERRGRVQAVSRRPGPVLGASFRGGSPGVAFDGGLLFVVHEAVTFEDGDRFYPHRWLWLDRDFAIGRISSQFYFRHRSLEYCAGLAVRGDLVVASFGVNDHESALATLSRHAVLAALEPVAAHAEAAGSRGGRRWPGFRRRSAGVPGPSPVGPLREPGGSGSQDGTLPPPARIVATTLTGDNADLIGDALRSVVGWVDACLVIDTGVTDASLEIARAVAGEKFVARRFAWTGDFAAARTFALESAAELGAGWAVTLDTDERLDPGPGDVRAALAATGADVVRVPHEGDTYAKERLFRLPAAGYWVGPTHECFITSGAVADLPGARFAEIAKTPAGYRRKFERDAALLAAHTAAHPDDPRWFYYLGDALQGLGRHREAIAAYETCAALRGWNEQAAWACYRAAECWLADGDHAAAIASCAAGLARHAGIAELAWLAGFASWQTGKLDQAVAWSRISIAMGCFRGAGNDVRRSGFRNPAALYEGPYDVLRHALRAAGDEPGAAEAERLHAAAVAARRTAVGGGTG